MVKSDSSQKYITPASIVKRVVAFFIDLFLLNLFVIGPFSSIFERFVGLDGSLIMDYKLLTSNPEVQSAITMALVAISVLFLFYFVNLQVKFGQTIGMMIMKTYIIKVPKLNINVPTKKKKKMSQAEIIEEARKFKITFFDALVRNLFIIPFFPFIILWIVEPIYMMIGPDKMRLLERLSRTRVVEINQFSQNNPNADIASRWF